MRFMMFDKNGKLLNAIGRQGQGPGEFSSPPVAIALDPSGHIVVAEMFRIDVFDNQGNYKKNFSAGFPINDMVINDKCEIILPALKNNKIMHAYSLEGEPISSFGEPLKPADELIQYKNFPNLQIPSRLFFTANKNICFIGLSKYVVYAYRQEKSVGTIDSDSPYFIPVSVIKGRREGSYSFMVPYGFNFGIWPTHDRRAFQRRGLELGHI